MTHVTEPSLLAPVLEQPPQFVAMPMKVTSRSTTAQAVPTTAGQNFLLPWIRPAIDHAAGIILAMPKAIINVTVKAILTSLCENNYPMTKRRLFQDRKREERMILVGLVMAACYISVAGSSLLE